MQIIFLGFRLYINILFSLGTTTSKGFHFGLNLASWLFFCPFLWFFFSKWLKFCVCYGSLLVANFWNDAQNMTWMLLRPDLRCWFTNRLWCQLRGQRSAGALAGNQLLPNAALKRSEKVLIDLIDGLSSGLVVLVDVADGDLADHDLDA